MLLGVSLPHHGPLSSPEAVRESALAAEALGFDALGVADHLAMPHSVSSKYTLSPEPTAIPDGNLSHTLTPLYDCLTTLAFVAALTRRVRLVTGVLVLPLRNPIYNARQIATIDAYSGGRVDLGIGVGWLKEEAEAMQMPWDERGARTDEHIAVLRALWEGKEPYVGYAGRFYRFEPIDPAPFPAQARLPILIGGHSPVALQRVVRAGDGWISTQLPVETQRESMEEIRKLAVTAGRDPEGLLWHGGVAAKFENGEVKSPQALLDAIAGYRDLGVHSLMVAAKSRSLADRVKLTEWLAKEALPIAHG